MPRSASVIAVTACEVSLLSRAALLAAFQDMSPTAAISLGSALHWDAAGGLTQHEPATDSTAPGTLCQAEGNAASWNGPPGPPPLHSSLQHADISLAQSSNLLQGTACDREAAGQIYSFACATAHEARAAGNQQPSYLSRTQESSLPVRNMLQALLELRTGEDLCEVQVSIGCPCTDADVGPEASERTGASDCFLHAG